MQFINPRIDRTSPSPRSTPRKHFKNARREWICRFDPRSIGGTRCGTINKMYPGSVCLGGGLCAPTNIRIFSRDTGQLIIITIPRMHTLHVFLSLRTRVCVCVCGSGSAPPTWRNVEWFCTLTARFSDLSPSPSPSLSLFLECSRAYPLSRFMERVKSNPFSSSQLSGPIVGLSQAFLHLDSLVSPPRSKFQVCWRIIDNILLPTTWNVQRLIFSSRSNFRNSGIKS